MVRLKVFNTFPIDMKSSFVSIPYGTIKRSCVIWTMNAANWFQFLMVRLKVIVTRTTNGRFSQFQFLMVRLKVQKSGRDGEV